MKIANAYLRLSVFGLLATTCLCGCGGRAKVTNEALTRYPPGSSFEKMKAELRLSEYEFVSDLNLPYNKSQGVYRMPEGDLMVSWILVESKPTLDSQPYIIEQK